MYRGSGAEHPGWATVLPGALLAGAGLGLVNTPVTNTTTASVPGDRSGMASGIDMSARLVSLAVNIAVMGLLLVTGIADGLRAQLSGRLAEPAIRALAQRVANGEDAAGGLAGPALARGFGLATLYGGVAACLIAAASLVTFGAGASAAARTTPARRCRSG